MKNDEYKPCVSELIDWVVKKNPEVSNLQLCFNIWAKQSKHTEKIKELFFLLKEEDTISDPAIILGHDRIEEMVSQVFTQLTGEKR